jgi:hypothetical protein
MIMFVGSIGVCWVNFYDRSGAGDAVFHCLFKVQAELGIKFEGHQSGREDFRWHTCIDKGTECHIAADA